MPGRRLPSGTLTFLFTDIEGSTKLGVALGTERYHKVLEMHTRTLRAAFNDGGTEVRIDGDSLVMVFASAGKAVRGAAAAQRGPCPSRAERKTGPLRGLGPWALTGAALRRAS